MPVTKKDLKERIVTLEDRVMMLEASGVGAKTYIWGSRTTIGGAAGTGAIDDIADASITDEDAVFLMDHVNERMFAYTWLDGDATAEHFPDIVIPDDSGGNGRWHGLNIIVTMDASANGKANEMYSGPGIITGRNAGEAIDQGNPVRWDNTDNEWVEADADLETCGDGDDPCWPAHGLALETGSNGNPMAVLTQGIVRHDDWNFTIAGNNLTLYLADVTADNAGVTQTAPGTAGDCVQVIGWAITDDEAYFNFSGHFLEVE